jgi:hypothetical protein
MEILFAMLLLPGYLLGFFMVAKGWEDVRNGLGARHWPQAPARLKECVLHHHVSPNGTFYEVRVAYEYTVAARRYQGDNVAIGYGGTNAAEVHHDLHRRLVSMAPFAVRYDPRRPEVSTILPAENALVFGLLVLGLGCLAFCAVFTLLVLAFSGVGAEMLQWATELLAGLPL